MMNTEPRRIEGPMTALIVEDRAVVRDGLRECIHAYFPDLRLLEARCGEEALALAAKERPQIVLMDIGLPGMDGIETTRSIRARAPGSYVVMVSGYEHEQYRKAAATAGAAAFIAKRNMPGDLVRLLDQLVPGFKRSTAAGRHGVHP